MASLPKWVYIFSQPIADEKSTHTILTWLFLHAGLQNSVFNQIGHFKKDRRLHTEVLVSSTTYNTLHRGESRIGEKTNRIMNDAYWGRYWLADHN